MRLRLTVVSTAERPMSRDVLVTAPDGSRLATISDHLCSAVGMRGRLYAGEAALPSDAAVGLPPLVDGATITIGRPGPSPSKSLLQLRVVGGPDAGHIVDVRPGRLTVGRGSDAALRINDPDASRTHAALDVTPDGLIVRDLGSTNGTSVEGESIDRAEHALRPGELLRIGSSSLSLAVAQQPFAAISPDAAGGLRISPTVRHHDPESPVDVELPAAPVPRQASQLSLLTALVPLVLAAGLLLVTRDAAMLWFLALSPVVGILHWVMDRVSRSRHNRRDLQRYLTERAVAMSHLSDVLRAEKATRRGEVPDPAAILAIACGPLSRVWERQVSDADFLDVRLGAARLPARVKLRVRDERTSASNGRLSQPTVEDVPVCINLRAVGMVGIAGPPHLRQALARSVIGQLVTLHMPRDVELLICSEHSENWCWTSWLPHTSAIVSGTGTEAIGPLVELIDQAESRAAASCVRGRGSEWSGPITVLILENADRWGDVPGLARLFRHGPRHGVIVVWLTTEATQLPAACSATITLSAAFSAKLRMTAPARLAIDDIIGDFPGLWWSEQLARRLAPLRDAAPNDAPFSLPTSARLLQLVGLVAPTPTMIVARWRTSTSTRVVLGVTSEGPFEIDLVRDGPHVLIAGTTGAGKSELLQTLVASLAIHNRPDEVAFLLVDYKGGAAFAECRALPHVVGLVTDLDAVLTERALRSLTAELRRRERILEVGGARDVDELREQYGSSPDVSTVPPRLVIVVDEFAALSEELPEFVAGLVGIAQRGRSLGIHLVLATQRPAGVVGADIKANTALRIALRVTDAAESLDVVDVSDAAMLPRQPGRGIARFGTAAPVMFQTARVSCPAHEIRPGDVDVQPLSPCWLPAKPEGAAANAEFADTDLAMLVAAAREAATDLGTPPLPSPWLPPLPDLLTVDDVRCANPSSRQTVLTLGVADYPDEQRQAPFGIDVAHAAHLVVAGGPRSGRSTTLRTLAGQVARFLPPSDLHLYALDHGDALRSLSALPHCGAVVRRCETTRGARLLARLIEEVDHRRERLSSGGSASVRDQRQAAKSESPPLLLLFVDGWEAFLEDYDGVDHGRPVDDLMRLLRDGPGAGVSAVITGGRNVLTGRVASVAARRLILRLPDRLDYGYAGVNPRRVPAHQPAGRGLLIDGPEPVDIQVALLTANPDGQAQSATLTRLAEQAVARARSDSTTTSIAPLRVEPLPAAVPFHALQSQRPDLTERAKPLWVALGLGGDDGRVLGVDLDADGPGFLVAGPRRSGRSSALLTLAKWYVRHREVTVLAFVGRGSPLATVAVNASLPGYRLPENGEGAVYLQTADDIAMLTKLAEGSQPLVVLVDDGDRLAETPVDAVLVQLLRSARPQTAVVIAGTTEDLASCYRGAVAEARRSRSGVLLNPAGPHDGDIFRVRTARSERRPGRGVLVVDGVATPLQVAHPGGDR